MSGTGNAATGSRPPRTRRWEGSASFRLLAAVQTFTQPNPALPRQVVPRGAEVGFQQAAGHQPFPRPLRLGPIARLEFAAQRLGPSLRLFLFEVHPVQGGESCRDGVVITLPAKGLPQRR